MHTIDTIPFESGSRPPDPSIISFRRRFSRAISGIHENGSLSLVSAIRRRVAPLVRITGAFVFAVPVLAASPNLHVHAKNRIKEPQASSSPERAPEHAGQLRATVRQEHDRVQPEQTISDKDFAKLLQLVERLKQDDDNTLIQLCLLLVTTVGAAVALKQLRDIKKSEFLEAFLTLCARFSEIQKSIASATNETETNAAFLDYFNLCSEEFFLWSEGYIPDKVWREWASGIRAFLIQSECREQWNTLKKNGWYMKEFVQFIDDCQRC